MIRPAPERCGLAFLLVVACVAVAFGSGLASATDHASAQVEVTNVTYDNESLAQRHGDRLYVWESGSHAVNVTVGPVEGLESDAEQCIRVAGVENASVTNVSSNNATATTLTCQPWPPDGANGTTNATTTTFDLETWAENRSGAWLLSYTLSTEGNATTVVASEDVPVVVVERDNDIDGDGLANEEEVSIGTNLSSTDTDRDGLDDGEEVNTYGTSPTDNDTDDDGLLDAQEINGKTDPLDPDTDNDSLGDAEEVEEYSTDPTKKDTDEDGLVDGVEVAKYETNPAKADTDGDGLPDGVEVDIGADPTDEDTDDDGLLDGEEYQLGTDPTDADTDDDFLDDSLEHRLGTNPKSALSTLVTLLIVAGVLGGSGYYVWRSLPPLEELLPATAGGGSAGATRGTHTNGRGPGAGSSATSPDDAAGPDHDVLLTDEDRVRQILEENGGRVGQSTFTEETEWSKSKVSRLLSKMEDNDQVCKINIGRENIITLPGEEPESSKSPHES